MTLAPGTRLGSYEIVAPLGAGGMGEVYRARDSRLGRDVAIKALPAALASDPERVARFEREAKLLASLNHPNVGAIYGLEAADAHRYLVLELVEGETLAQRLARGALPIGEALDVCRQIATALEAAHEAGVVHRDLKPGNVMLAANGVAKVLDFGLAKGATASGTSSSDPNLSASPTMTYAATDAGVVLGTAAYMSPEQARGKAVDKRTDIWSLGCVLYECLTGRQAFEGETVSDLIARILEREPDLGALPARTPARVRELLGRCLEKDARRRLRDVGDARIEIENAIAARASGESGSIAAAKSAKRRSKTFEIALVIGASLLSVVATKLATRWLEKPPAPRLTRFEIRSPEGQEIFQDPAFMALSPDGRVLAFVAGDSAGTAHIWLRNLGALTARPLAGTEAVTMLFWSPDSRHIGFFADGKLKKIKLTDGAIENLCDAPNGRGGTWSPDGVILFSPTSESPIFRVSSNGGAPQQVTTLDSTRGEKAHRFPKFLSDGRHYLFSVLAPPTTDITTWCGALDSPRRDSVVSGISGVTIARGYLLYSRGGTLVAQRFDERRRRVEGPALSLGDAPKGTDYLGGSVASAAFGGMLAFMSNREITTRLAEYDRQGKELRAVPLASARYFEAMVSPDGRRAALVRRDSGTESSIWMADLERGTATRFSSGVGTNEIPIWSPDGGQVVFISSRGGNQDLYIRPANGAEPEAPLFLSNTPFARLGSWSHDGRYLVFGRLSAETSWDIWVIPMNGDRKPVPYLQTPIEEEFGEVSPDGKWMVYDSYETGRQEVYVQSFPTPGEKHQITTDGGAYPTWSLDGKQIVYGIPPSGLKLMIADVVTEPEFRVVGTPRELVRFDPKAIWTTSTPDFKRVWALVPSGASAPPSITVVLDWTGALEQP